jgi:NAD-dependent protein deacetylase/lipoamidase
MDDATREKIDQVAEALAQRRHGVAVTGAGISVDSGIPDFRSRGGLWDRFDPMEYATIDAFRQDPHRVWKMLEQLDGILRAAAPNPGHLALASLEAMGVLDGVVTQNVDNLHQEAGSKHVVEFHGNGSQLVCIACGARCSAEEVDPEVIPPVCACGAVLKPDVIFFGEMIPEEALKGSMELVEGCQVMLVVGTSATVAPCSQIPLVARRQGAMLAEFNLHPTELTSGCDVAVLASASETLPALAEAVSARL